MWTLATLSMTLIGLSYFLTVANGVALVKRDVKTCPGYVPNIHHVWSPLTEIKYYYQTQIKVYNEYVSYHDAKGQYIRFAAATSHKVGYPHLAFSNRPVRNRDKGHQKSAVYRYNVLFEDGGSRSYVLHADQRCLDNGHYVPFPISSIKGFSVDILND